MNSQPTQEQIIIDSQKVISVPKDERLNAQEEAMEELNSNSRGTHFKVKEEDFVPQLVGALQNDFTIEEACSYAGIAKRTYYRRLKENPEFAEKMEKAKMFSSLQAKQRVTQILLNGKDRDAGPMARWLLEKRQPEIYGNTAVRIQQNQQNNFYVLTTQQINELCKIPDIANSNPSELLEALEEMSKEETTSKENLQK